MADTFNITAVKKEDKISTELLYNSQELLHSCLFDRVAGMTLKREKLLQFIVVHSGILSYCSNVNVNKEKNPVILTISAPL